MSFKIELGYWDRELSLQGEYPDAIRNRYITGRTSKEFPLWIIPYLEELEAVNKRIPRIADIGSGPLSQLTYGHNKRLLDLWAVDPLADEYKKLLKKHNIPEQKYYLCQCPGEELSEYFNNSILKFDLVWTHNALDHSQEPVKVFEEMAKITEPGGYIIFQGWKNEGEHNGYYGLHQHDIYFIEDIEKLMVKTRGKEEAETFTGDVRLIDYELKNYPGREWIKVIWKKN